MRLLERRCRQPAMLLLINVYAILLSSFIASVSGNASATPEAVVVSNPSQFQRAVRQGVNHIVIAEHLDMTNTPRFSETTIMDAGMIAIVPNEQNEYTKSIRVRPSATQIQCCNMYLNSILCLLIAIESVSPYLSCV